MPKSARMQLLAWFLQVQAPSRGGGCGSRDYLYAGDTHFRRDRTTQLIKCTPWSTRLHPHPTIIKKMKTFLEVEGKMGPIRHLVVNSGLYSQTPIPTSEKAMSLKREREPHLRSLGQ